MRPLSFTLIILTGFLAVACTPYTPPIHDEEQKREAVQHITETYNSFVAKQVNPGVPPGRTMPWFDLVVSPEKGYYPCDTQAIVMFRNLFDWKIGDFYIEVDWGDGSPFERNNYTPKHFYAKPGTYRVQAILTTKEGMHLFDSKRIEIW